MTKSEFISRVSAKSGISKKDSDAVVVAFCAVAGEALAAGEDVALTGFGTFKLSHSAERKGRNPRTKEEIIIPASNNVKFVAAKALKEVLD